MKKQVIFILGFILLISLACSPKVSPAPLLSEIETGLIATEGVEIISQDGTFTLKYGEKFNTPFFSPNHLVEAVSSNETPIVNDVYKILNKEYKDYVAKKVKVKTPYLETPLYGVIMFCKVPKECQTSLVTRSYRISIPESYVKAALGGGVSCIYEYYTCFESYKSTTWVLWLSDSPF